VDGLNPPENSNVEVYANSSAPSGSVTLDVDDTENKFSKTIKFNISN